MEYQLTVKLPKLTIMAVVSAVSPPLLPLLASSSGLLCLASVFQPRTQAHARNVQHLEEAYMYMQILRPNEYHSSRNNRTQYSGQPTRTQRKLTLQNHAPGLTVTLWNKGRLRSYPPARTYRQLYVASFVQVLVRQVLRLVPINAHDTRFPRVQNIASSTRRTFCAWAILAQASLAQPDYAWAWVRSQKTEARHSSPVEASNGETALTMATMVSFGIDNRVTSLLSRWQFWLADIPFHQSIPQIRYTP